MAPRSRFSGSVTARSCCSATTSTSAACRTSSPCRTARAAPRYSPQARATGSAPAASRPRRGLAGRDVARSRERLRRWREAALGDEPADVRSVDLVHVGVLQRFLVQPGIPGAGFVLALVFEEVMT